jgi:hypothetical protein
MLLSVTLLDPLTITPRRWAVVIVILIQSGSGHLLEVLYILNSYYLVGWYRLVMIELRKVANDEISKTKSDRCVYRLCSCMDNRIQTIRRSRGKYTLASVMHRDA